MYAHIDLTSDTELEGADPKRFEAIVKAYPLEFPYCQARAPGGGLVCTRRLGHQGPHVAHCGVADDARVCRSYNGLPTIWNDKGIITRGLG